MGHLFDEKFSTPGARDACDFDRFWTRKPGLPENRE